MYIHFHCNQLHLAVLNAADMHREIKRVSARYIADYLFRRVIFVQYKITLQLVMSRLIEYSDIVAY